MAKKKTTKKTAIAILDKPSELVETALTISNEDVIAVGISHAETHMDERIDACKANSKKLSDRYNKMLKSVHKQLHGAAEDYYSEKLAVLKDVAVTLGAKTPTLQVNEDFPEVEDGKYAKVFTVNISLSSRHGKKKGDKPAGHTSLDYSDVAIIKVPAAVLDTLKQMQTAIADKAASDNEMIDWKRKKNQIPVLERKYKARIAEAKLQSVEGGQELLDSMLATISEDVLALPGG